MSERGASGKAAGDISMDSREVAASLFQKQQKIYARAVSGWFAGWRWALVWLTQLAYYGGPWLEWSGRQALLFDLAGRRFYIFGLVFYPQDFIYLSGLLIVCAYALFLFTAVAGRLWCGYACPQTVYTELFMWIERRIEGDRPQQMKLDAAPWSAGKALRKTSKHLVWLALGLWTGITLVGYFTPIRELWASVLTLGLGPWEWFWILFYGLATYGNAGFLREQVCKYMCPYARFQGAMFDPQTLIIGYDRNRGEPRGPRGRKTDLQAAELGHCIDCGLCVQVCPTGIDIRNGLQYECIGCAACIDVCNHVMDKMHYPRGLVRYDTQAGLDEPQNRSPLLRRLWRPRVLVYSAVLLLLCAGLVAGLMTRSPFRVDVVRDRGVMARTVEDGWVENVYRLQIMNATEMPQRYHVSATGLPEITGAISRTSDPDQRGEVQLNGAEARWVALALRVPPEVAARAGTGSHPIVFTVSQQPTTPADAGRQVLEKSSFIVPR